MADLTCPIEALPFSRSGLIVVNPLQDPGWDHLVLTHTGSSVFHSAGWAKVLSSTYGHRPMYLLNGQLGRLNTLVPFMELTGWANRKRGVSLPFTDYCDPLLSAETGFTDAFMAAVALGRRQSWTHLEIRTGGEIAGFERPSLEFFGHAIDLNRAENAIFSAINSTLRNEIRKAERSGVEVVLTTESTGMTLYYRLHCLTRKKHGLPPQPFSFFSKIHEHLVSKGSGFVALAFLRPGSESAVGGNTSVDVGPSHPPILCQGNRRETLLNGAPIAGGVFLSFGRRAVYKFGASDESQVKVPAGKLVLWRAIQYCKSQGFEALEMGRTSLANAGLRRFKLAWGAEERRVRNLKYDLIQDRFVVERDNVYGWYNRFFATCPASLSRVIGRCLYPHLD